MAGRLIDEDPQLAFAHAEAARRRASRLPVAREASAETAYAAGEYAHALNEYRALRRMTGSAEYLPVIMDCERALGRPQRALQLAREGATAQLDVGTRAEMLIVESGARTDLGQHDEAVRLLRAAVARVQHPAGTAARLRFAYAELLLDDDPAQARALLDEADLLDPDSGARERLDELDGLGLGDIELAGDELEGDELEGDELEGDELEGDEIEGDEPPDGESDGRGFDDAEFEDEIHGVSGPEDGDLVDDGFAGDGHQDERGASGPEDVEGAELEHGEPAAGELARDEGAGTPFAEGEFDDDDLRDGRSEGEVMAGGLGEGDRAVADETGQEASVHDAGPDGPGDGTTADR